MAELTVRDFDSPTAQRRWLCEECSKEVRRLWVRTITRLEARNPFDGLAEGFRRSDDDLDVTAGSKAQTMWDIAEARAKRVVSEPTGESQ